MLHWAYEFTRCLLEINVLKIKFIAEGFLFRSEDLMHSIDTNCTEIFILIMGHLSAKVYIDWNFSVLDSENVFSFIWALYSTKIH